MQQDVGLLFLRVAASSMILFGHGLGKAMSYMSNLNSFPDPLGIGSPVSATLATFAEFLCSILVLIGFKARLAAIPLVITMLVAGFIVHGADPWARKELAFLYAVCFISIALVGPGEFSVDGKMGRNHRLF